MTARRTLAPPSSEARVILKRGRSGRLYTHLDLMHPTPLSAPFDDPEWLFEQKMDGFRAMVQIRSGLVTISSRRGNALAPAFPDAVGGAIQLRRDAVLDTEIVVLDVKSRPDWGGLRRRAVMTRTESIGKAVRETPAVLVVFDVLAIGGEDVRAKPLVHRKALLASLILELPALYLLPSVFGTGVALYRKALEQGLEGIVGKRLDAPYRAGRRPEWIKVKNPVFQEAEAKRFDR